MEPNNTAILQKMRAKLAQKARDADAPLLSAALSRYAEAEGMDWNALAASIGCDADQLNRIAICYPPREASFVADVEAIAEGCADAGRLLPLLRRLQILQAFSLDRAAETRADYTGAGQSLLAARDRETPEPTDDSDNPDRETDA